MNSSSSKRNLARQLIDAHLREGEAEAGKEIGLCFHQTLTQDATGTLIMLMLEAIELNNVKTDLSAQYVDHNLLQVDNKNPDDHRFLLSACERFGLWYSRPGNGISHAVHMQHFGIPGSSLIGADSHTCAAGSLGMLAIGAGGADIVQAMAGQPVYLRMPEIWGIELTGELPDWVSAKDVILELLRRHDVDGGVQRILEYFGPGVASLSAMDRHVIANMGAELGATTTVFPSDQQTRAFLRRQHREKDWRELKAEKRCEYEHHDQIDLSTLEPLIAKPSSPGNVVPVNDVAGEPIFQSYIGSSANPGYRDFAIVAELVRNQILPADISLDINPSSRQILRALSKDGRLEAMLAAGARLHQIGCNGCIGMGQAPATDQNSLRTTPRNFPGRSGTREDKVWLCSPETAAASALTGKITDGRSLKRKYPRIEEPEFEHLDQSLFVKPRNGDDKHAGNNLIKGPNIARMPELKPLPETITLPVLLKLGDHVSTDEILPAGTDVLPYRSNIPEIGKFSFNDIAPEYHERVAKLDDDKLHLIIGGKNFGQGSSREHAALAPRHLGLVVVLAKSFARIYWQNLINFGVLPLTFANANDADKIEPGDKLSLKEWPKALSSGESIAFELNDGQKKIELRHQLSERHLQLLKAGGIVPWLRKKLN